MADEQEAEPASAGSPAILGSALNVGEPLRFTNVQPLCGFASEAARKGERIKIWTKLALTSDDQLFHLLVRGIAGHVDHMAQQAGILVDLRRSNTVLLVLKPDATAELWLDTAPVSIHCLSKRTIKAGTVVFENDIADVTGMSFPCVTFGQADKVLCLFRVDWRFAFAFNMNPEGKLDLEEFSATLGTLYRRLRYKDLYDAVSEPALFDRLLTAGWFPFVEIITAEFRTLSRHCENDFEIGEVEEEIVAKFDNVRMQNMLERWVAKAHFFARQDLLKAAITAFCNRDPIAVIKIVLTEIEGVLRDAYRAEHDGKSATLTELLDFAEASAERKSGGSHTLLFPKEFGQYLRQKTFANFDPVARTGTASSRHAVGHGAAPQDSYTMPRALQAMLTLDQLAFYT